MHMAKRRKPVRKGYILCDPNYVTFWKRRNYRDSKGSAVARGLEGGREGGMVFRAVKTFCVILEQWMDVIT